MSSIMPGTGAYNVSYYGNCRLAAYDVIKVYGKIYYEMPDTALYNKLKDYVYKKCQDVSGYNKSYRQLFVNKSTRLTPESLRLLINRLNKIK